MLTFVWVTSLLAISSAVWSAQVPCTDESCTNLNIFLGPKWGSKTLRIPNNFRAPIDGEVMKFMTERPSVADEVVDKVVKVMTERPSVADEVVDKVAKPTDWVAKSEDEVNETDWASEPSENGEEDDPDWPDDFKVAQPTAMPLEKIHELNRKIIDWAGDSSTKLSAEVMVPTGKPADWVSQRVHIDSQPLQTKNVIELQDVTEKYAGKTANSRFIMPYLIPVSEDDSYEADYSDDYETDLGFDTNGPIKSLSTTWKSVHNLNMLSDQGTLNLTLCGYSGELVKQTLAGLSVDTRTQLRRLYLSGNQIRSLPAFTFPVELEYGLVELYLDNNPLSVLDSFTRFELSRLGNLKVLSLARTGLQFFESLYVPSLESLDLSGNKLPTLPFGLDGFRALRHLDLSSNHITELTGPVPTVYESLRSLNLSNNGLQFIWNNPFERMVYLDVLCLTNNNLNYWIQIKDIPNTITLYLSGNQWECSCPMSRFVHESLVADKNTVLCTDQNIRLPWPVNSLSDKDLTIDCPRRWDWIRLPVQRVERWFNSHGWHMSSLLSVVGWVVLVLGLVAVWRAVRRYQNTTAPYSILDDKQVI